MLIIHKAGSRVSVETNLGYRDIEADSGSEFQKWNALSGTGSVTFKPAGNFIYTVYGGRNVVYSLYQDSSYFDDQKVGGSIEAHLGWRTALRGYYEDGKNDYEPLPGAPHRIDDFKAWGGDLQIKLGDQIDPRPRGHRDELRFEPARLRPRRHGDSHAAQLRRRLRAVLTALRARIQRMQLSRSLRFLLLAILIGVPAAAQTPSVSGYRIGPKDLIEVKVFEVPELNVERRVAENGAGQLPLIGDVPAAGLTAAEFAPRLKELLEAKYVQRASVAVEVREFRSKPISVIGAVKTPGPLAFSGRWTLLEALAAAGGMSDDHGDYIYVMRHAENGLSDQVAIRVEDLMVRGRPARQPADLRQRPDQRGPARSGHRLLPRRGAQPRRPRLLERRADHRAVGDRPRRRPRRARLEEHPDQAPPARAGRRSSRGTTSASSPARKPTGAARRRRAGGQGVVLLIAPPNEPWGGLRARRPGSTSPTISQVLRRHWKLVGLSLRPVLARLSPIHYVITPKLYRAATTLQIERRSTTSLTGQQNPWLENYWKMEYYPTQYRLLQSRGLAERVVLDLRLMEDPEFSPGTAAARLERLGRRRPRHARRPRRPAPRRPLAPRRPSSWPT